MVRCPVCEKTSDLIFRKEIGIEIYNIYKCTFCGLGFVYPLPDFQQLLNIYTNIAYYRGSFCWGYSGNYSDLESGLKVTYKKILMRVFNLYPGIRIERVLDVGCAKGFFLDVAKELGALFTLGIDPSEVYREDLEKKGHIFIKGFLENIELNCKFDFIFMGDVFEHILDPGKAVEKISELLDSDGIIVISTVDFSSLIARFLKDKWRLLTPPEHLYFWTPKSIKLLFEKKGFKGRTLKYWLFYPKDYVLKVFKKQFGFYPYFIKLWPRKLVPVFGFDVLLAIFTRTDHNTN